MVINDGRHLVLKLPTTDPSAGWLASGDLFLATLSLVSPPYARNPARGWGEQEASHLLVVSTRL